MTAHKHAEMIKAKADNMDLVVFVKRFPYWEMDDRFPPSAQDIKERWFLATDFQWKEDEEYFLCLPQNKEACLHWLNGGEVQLQDFPTNSFDDYLDKHSPWSNELWWMSEQCNIRIKPRKEKLWIAVKTDKHETLGGCRNVRICSHAFVNKQDAIDYLDLDSSQLVEIEVEV